MFARLASSIFLIVFIGVISSPLVAADVTGTFDVDITLVPLDTQFEAVKYFFDIQSNLMANVTVSGLTYGPDLGFGTTGLEFSVLNLTANMGALTLQNKLVFATPFVSLDLSNKPPQIIPTLKAPGVLSGVAFVSNRLITSINVGGVTLMNEAIFEDVDFHGPFDVPARNLDNGDQNGDGCPGRCGVDDDGDGQVDEGSINNDDEDQLLVAPFTEFVDEDPPGDANLDGCPGRCGIDDDGDVFIDGADPQVIACGAPCATADDDEDGLVDEDVGDSLFDEDPWGDANGDGCAGVCGIDDDNDGEIDEGPINDDDEDGVVDEDFGKTVYFVGSLNNVAGDQTPSFAFGDRITVTGQTVSGITVSSSLGICFEIKPKTVKKRSFNGSVNPGCIFQRISNDKTPLFFDFLTLLVQNISVGGMVFNVTGDWRPLEGSTLTANTTIGLLGIANLTTTYVTKTLTDLAPSSNLLLSILGENFSVTLIDSGANFDFDAISFNTNVVLNANSNPVNLSTNTSISKGSGITGQSVTLSVSRQPFTFASSTSFFGSGRLNWQSTSFTLSSDLNALGVDAIFTFGPTGLTTSKIELGVVF